MKCSMIILSHMYCQSNLSKNKHFRTDFMDSGFRTKGWDASFFSFLNFMNNNSWTTKIWLVQAKHQVNKCLEQLEGVDKCFKGRCIFNRITTQTKKARSIVFFLKPHLYFDDGNLYQDIPASINIQWLRPLLWYRIGFRYFILLLSHQSQTISFQQCE